MDIGAVADGSPVSILVSTGIMVAIGIIPAVFITVESAVDFMAVTVMVAGMEAVVMVAGMEAVVMVAVMADTDNSIEGLAKYLVAVIKCNDDGDESAKLVSVKLKELVNAELDACNEIAQVKEKEWGDVAVRVNTITQYIRNQIAARKIA